MEARAGAHAAVVQARAHETTARLWHVIAASTGGTLIEWYDFYIYGSLATVIAGAFFPPGHPTAAFLATLATFATGFAVRPFGALVFGRIGDLVGRKYAFLVTLTIMGGSTMAIGLVPSYASIGLFAPLIVLLLRLLQGLALGGEYGGAAVYVAEHAPDGRRGFYTSFIQTTATLGLFVSLGVILAVRLSLPEADFNAWGWRVPFLLSSVLLALSLYMRVRLKESPLFSRLKQAGRTSRSPLRETGRNWKLMALALFGATAGQGVVWYTGQFYALYFLQNTLKVPFVTSNVIIAVALALGTPFFIFFGWLSDKVGRKPVMMAGNLLAVLTYYPIYQAMKAFSDPFNPVGLTLMVFLQVLYVTMVYGPIAAFLVELFPAKIRYTSLSLPYHLGNGWFGGFTPLIASSAVAATGNIYAGLVYPVAVAAMTFVVGTLLVKETHKVSIWEEVEGLEAAGAE
ncbi:MFS transporter [Carboxydochorda subterranea]|uniref:MFS transporter n=1 Tax=Carboxydichorda subterranea TaxID=3109565 RepID=A0ABZ1BY43_9FIRM|nr:MFS transporter [Limnochorda sp. L945t]WRP17461.1 MFS transporter [Limnochorda sp. L945t]